MVKLTANNVAGAINAPLMEPYASNSQMMRGVIAGVVVVVIKKRK